MLHEHKREAQQNIICGLLKKNTYKCIFFFSAYSKETGKCSGSTFYTAYMHRTHESMCVAQSIKGTQTYMLCACVLDIQYIEASAVLWGNSTDRKQESGKFQCTWKLLNTHPQTYKTWCQPYRAFHPCSDKGLFLWSKVISLFSTEFHHFFANILTWALFEKKKRFIVIFWCQAMSTY